MVGEERTSAQAVFQYKRQPVKRDEVKRQAPGYERRRADRTSCDRRDACEKADISGRQ